MFTAKIIRHRHTHHHYINDDLKKVTEETHFKIIFSHPEEMIFFQTWCKEHQGEYEFDKHHQYVKGKLPVLDSIPEDFCWCDIMTYYLLHVAAYSYHSSIHPYKGEVYVKGI